MEWKTQYCKGGNYPNCHRAKLLSFAAAWISLMLNEVNQTEKDKYHRSHLQEDKQTGRLREGEGRRAGLGLSVSLSPLHRSSSRDLLSSNSHSSALYRPSWGWCSQAAGLAGVVLPEEGNLPPEKCVRDKG